MSHSVDASRMQARGESMRPREPEARPDRAHGPQRLLHVRHPGEPANNALTPVDALPAARGNWTTSASSASSIDTDWTRILYYDIFAVDGEGAVETWARHALAANGFGDSAADARLSSHELFAADARLPSHELYAADARLPSHEIFAADAHLSNHEIHRVAGIHRARFLGRIFASAIRAAVDIVREANARRRRRWQANAIRDALHELDDRTLHDLGFDRSEIASVAAEATDAAERTRIRSRSITTP